MRKIPHLSKPTRPPNWFDLNKYEAAASLDAEGWATQISSRIYLQNLQRQTSDELVKQFNEALEELTNHPFSDLGFPVEYPSNQSVYPLTCGIAQALVDTCSCHGLKPNDKCDDKFIESGIRSFDRRAHLIIDLRAKKSTIKKHFEMWLDNTLGSPGNSGRKNAISKATLASWANFKILPYNDLMLWYSCRGELQPAIKTLAKWLFPSTIPPEEMFKETRKKAKEAFSQDMVRELLLIE